MQGNSRFLASRVKPGKKLASVAEPQTSHAINQKQHQCWMSAEALVPVCSCWILFENTSRHQKHLRKHHWKNRDLSPGSIAQYVLPVPYLLHLVQASLTKSNVWRWRPRLLYHRSFSLSPVKSWSLTQEDLQAIPVKMMERRERGRAENNKKGKM